MSQANPFASDLELVNFVKLLFFCHLTALTVSVLSGYEMYTTMRADSCLCFLERVGRPDDKAIDAEQHTGDAELGDE